MDFKSKLLLLFAAVVLVVYTDGAVGSVTTTNTTETVANVTVETITSKPAVTTEPTTKAPITCNVGSCAGEVCLNTTIAASYRESPCITGVCVTEKTVVNGTSVYNFKCSSKDCAADKAAAPKGTTVYCCVQPNCNTYESVHSSATRAYSISVAILTVITYILSM